jgi:fructose-1,6-bisphosphatase-3
MIDTYLPILAQRYPSSAAALAEIANLQAILALPTPPVHVLSDVHGDHVKLRQVVNNASGSLRPLFERLLGARVTPTELRDLLNLVYYPRETWQALTRDLDATGRRARLLWLVPHMVCVLRELSRFYTLKHLERVVPDPYDLIMREALFAHEMARAPDFIERLVDPFLRHDRELDLVRTLAHVVRNLAVGELIIAGDLGDRGPRIDKVIAVVQQQPRVTITWGNHDASWMAACLGQPAAIATVVRMSLRYQRLAQLEEGYGIAMAPVEQLARTIYGDDPAERFASKPDGLRDAATMARMQKAIAILQFKLEGALYQRTPAWDLGHRALLHRIDPAARTITIGDRTEPLLDAHFPTIDWTDPYALAPAEAACLAALTTAFVESAPLWQQMSYVAAVGRMFVRRDRCAIFHGCVPVDEAGAPLPFVVDGEPRAGKALFEALEVVVQRAFRKRAPADLDLLFYLWTGPLSPCFGKDKMATFESYFVADHALREETKNPYFRLIHEVDFCARMLRELGVDEHAGFLVNGHVPVRLEAGELPVKRSGRAITIDGAFAAAYGDKGFSLVLDARRLYLAQHHHFESAEDAVGHGADIVPTVTDVAIYDRPRVVADTERGDELRDELVALEALVGAFDANAIRELP